MGKKVNVSYCAIFAYFIFVIGACLLVGLLPPFISRPACKTEANKTRWSPMDEAPAVNAPRVRRDLETSSPRDKTLDTKIAAVHARHPEATWWPQSTFHTRKPRQDLLPSCGDLDFMDGPWTNMRLPKHIIPTNYDLDLHLVEFDKPDLYEGLVEITVELTEDTDTILIHNKLLLTFGEVITNAKNELVEIACGGFYQRNDYLVLKTKRKMLVSESPLKITLVFEGFLDTYESGLFEFGFGTLPEKRMIASRFEPMSARKAFPCFDEPHFKATLNLRVIHPINTTALSNEDLLEKEPSAMPNMLLSHFKTTPKLPTYMYAILLFDINDFSFEHGMSNSGVPITIWAQKAYVFNQNIRATLQMAQDIFSELEEIFAAAEEAIPSQLKVFAIPRYETVSIGHHGLPIFLEDKILFKNETASERKKQEIALLMAKQFSQTWFGNYVTMDWWDQIWLQEALSNYFKYKVIEQVYPTWNIHDQFITEELIQVLVQDGYPSSHPIQKTEWFDDSSEIEEYFDTVETSKGTAILRMMETELSGNVFMLSIINYISANRFGTGNVQSFTDAIGNIRKWPAADFLDRWIKQANYPVLTIRVEERAGLSYLSVVQDRAMNSQFSIWSTDQLYPSPWDFVWYVPLKCTFGKDRTDDTGIIRTFDVDTKNFEALIGDGKDKYKWVHCDSNFDGYYLNDYSRENWYELASALRARNPSFEATDRANIIHNVFLNAYSERSTSYNEVVEIMTYLTQEHDYLPWRTVHKHVFDMVSILEYRESFFPVAKYFTDLMRGLEEEWGVDTLWTPSYIHIEELTKETILELACRLQDMFCLKKVSEIWPEAFQALISGGENNIPPYVRDIVYSYHFQNTYDVSEWTAVFREYAGTIDLQEEDRCLRALTFVRLPWLLADLMESLKKNGLKEIDLFQAIELLSRNPLGREITWDFVRRNYEELMDSYGDSDPRLGQVIIDVADTFENEFLYQELLQFITSIATHTLRNAHFKVLEIVSTNWLWLVNNEDEISEALGPKVGGELRPAKSANEVSIEFAAAKARLFELNAKYLNKATFERSEL